VSFDDPMVTNNLEGQQLGAYQLSSRIGVGGMGEVYRAHDPRLGREIAIKVLPAAFAADRERLHRFEQEARAAAALNHPNIVTIHSVEELNGIRFLTMELLEGQPLSDVIPPGGLPLDRLLDVATPLADALAAAHAKGITHRDLKPANVMVGADRRVTVLDFGLAKLHETSPVAGWATALPTVDMTGEGRIVGTVAYMSPEQAAGKPIAKAIAERLRVTLPGGKDDRLVGQATTNIEAYQLYLKGRALLDRRGASVGAQPELRNGPLLVRAPLFPVGPRGLRAGHRRSPPRAQQRSVVRVRHDDLGSLSLHGRPAGRGD
jgi:serine/threonine protein kinase